MKALLSMMVMSAFLWTAAGCGPKAQTTPASSTPAAGTATPSSVPPGAPPP
jgi:predicted small lipoprotein YifL